MIEGFWFSLIYWTLIIIFLLVLLLLVLVVKDAWKTFKLIQSPVQCIPGNQQPFCAQVDVELVGDALLSPLLHKTCLHYSSRITKHYSRKLTKNYYEASQQADYQMRCGKMVFLPPEKEKIIYLQPEYQFHKKWLHGDLPPDLEANLRQLQLEESFWKGLKKTAIDFDEGLLPLDKHLWVCGRLQFDGEQSGQLPRLIGWLEGAPPLVSPSYQNLKQQAFYDLVSYISGTFGLAVFGLVAIYLFSW